MSRKHNDLAARFPILAKALAELPDETSIDGELVALDETGRPSFNVLQNYRRAGTPIQFYAFDVLTFAGRSLQNQPLEERRKVLQTKMMPRMLESVLFSETLEATASEVTEAVRAQGLEGVIAKRRDSLYEPGRRSGAWVKMRVNKGRELVVSGYLANGKNFDSIVVGYYEGDDLLYVARVRNGFTPVAADAKLTQGRRLKIDPPRRGVLRSGGPHVGGRGSGGNPGLETARQKHPRDRADSRRVAQHGATLSAGRRAAALHA